MGSGGGAPHDKFRLDDDFLRIAAFAGRVDASQQGFGGDDPHFAKRLVHRCEAGILKRSGLDVIKADDGDVFRDEPARFAEGVDGADSGGIIEGNKSREVGVALEKPASDAVTHFGRRRVGVELNSKRFGKTDAELFADRMHCTPANFGV